MSIPHDGPTYCIQDLQQAQPAGVCHNCHGEFYDGEKVFLEDGKTLCKDCFKARIMELLDTSPDILASLMGAQMETALEGSHAHI